MPTLPLDLPDDVFSALCRSPEEFEREMRLAAPVADLRHAEFSRALAREGAE